MEIEVLVKQKVEVKYLQVKAGVRYWEDSEINGVDDLDGKLIPLRIGDYWCPVIDVESGKILGWPDGVGAKIHYKVCDDGEYCLLNSSFDEVVYSNDEYVPSMLSIGENGYGDYIILNIDGSGVIDGFKFDLEPFLPQDLNEI